jgi:hypothetical protein
MLPHGWPMPQILLDLKVCCHFLKQFQDGLDREQVKAVIEFAIRGLDKEPTHAP